MSNPPVLASAVIVFGAALLVAWAFRHFGAPAVIGFLFAGIVIGPMGLDRIPRAAVEQFAEIGLVLLVFGVGLELSPEPLVRYRRQIVLAATLQIVLTAAATIVALTVWGGLAGLTALIIGLVVCNSSTAIVLAQLAERGETNSPVGVISAGFSLLQDVVVILFILMLPVLAPTGAGGWAEVVGRGALNIGALAAAVLAARRILPLVLNQLFRAGRRDLTTLFTIVTACAGAWLASLAGWSYALGACIAGLLLAETDVRHQLFSEIVPLRDAFSALFFVSLGMLIRPETVYVHAGPLALAILATLAGKALLTAAATLAAGWPLRLSVHVGLALATISEFGFILANEAERHRLLPAGLFDLLVAYCVGTMFVGAILVPLAGPAAALASRRLRPRTSGGAPTAEGVARENHVIIVGYGLNGENLARVLKATGIPHCVVELNRELSRRAAGEGRAVVVGDATRPSILERAGLAAARALVVAINDTPATRQIVAQARGARPDLYILARTRYVNEIEPLRRLGANEVIPEEFETSVEIFAHVLKEFAVPDNVVAAQVAMVRAGQYSMLRGGPGSPPPRSDLLRLLELTATQTFLVEAGSRGAGRTIRELDLRRASGASIIAVVRGGRPITNPDGDTRLEPNDVLVLVGAHKQLDAARAALGP